MQEKAGVIKPPNKVYIYMNNQVHRALFRKEGQSKERERKKMTTTSTA